MYFGYYNDPINKIEIPKKEKKENPKILCVISVYCGELDKKEYGSINEDGNLEIRWQDDKLEALKLTLKCYEFFKTKIPYEILIVDNGTTDRLTLDFLQTIPYKIIRRENKGFSFGAYRHIWRELGSVYDYYLFQEQDYSPCKNYWLDELYEAFLSNDEIGAIGNCLESRGINDAETNNEVRIVTRQPRFAIGSQLQKCGTKRNWLCNLDGPYVFTSSAVLASADTTGGIKLLDCDTGDSGERHRDASMNELMFTQPFLELGYKIAAFGTEEFSLCERIYFFGQRTGSLTRPFEKEKLVPIIDNHTKFLCPQIHQYFNEIGL